MTRSIIIAFLIAAYTLASVAAHCATAIHPPFVKVWEFEAPAQFENYVKSPDAIYFGAYDSFGAVDVKTGRRLWETSLKEKASGIRVAYDGNTLYAAAGQYKLLACEPKTGKVRWSLPIKGYSGPMAISGGVLYCELKDGVLAALDVRTRKLRWTLNLEPRPLSKKSMRDLGLSADPLIVKDRLFLGTNAGEVICADPAKGKVVWRQSSGASDEPQVSSMAADARRIYFTTRGGNIQALDIRTGKRSWRFAGEGYVYDGSPVMAGGLAIFGTESGMLYGIKASDGSKLWEVALPGYVENRTSPPVADSGHVLITAASGAMAFDLAGKQLWSWDTQEDLYCHPTLPLDDGVIVSGAHQLYRLRMGQPAGLPTQPAERQAMATKLISRLDKLTKDEKRTLVKLGDDAFPPLLEVVKQRMKIYDELAGKNGAQRDDDSYKVYERFSDAFELIRQVAHKNRTAEMLALLASAERGDTRGSILQWLAEHGYSEQTTPIFLAEATKTGDDEDEYNTWGIAVSALASSSDPRAISFMIGQLADPTANPGIRRAAFGSLARTGGKPGLDAVLAARDTSRTIPSLRELMHLDELGPSVRPQTEDYQWPWQFFADLLDTRKDSSGSQWGLIASRASGSLGDLWIARYDGRTWGDPLFTGVTAKQLGKSDWLARFADKPALAVDSDADGWTDLLEKRLGTDPKSADTDGDGIRDSQDKNPLAAPRELSDGEKVLGAAFQARFQFQGDRPSVFLVELPKGIRPFELYGCGWVTIALEAGRKSPLQALIGKGVGTVSFRLPRYDLTGNLVRDETSGACILWNADHTEATVQVSTRFGGLDGTGFDMHLKRFGSEWVVIGSRMAWIS